MFFYCGRIGAGFAEALTLASPWPGRLRGLAQAITPMGRIHQLLTTPPAGLGLQHPLHAQHVGDGYPTPGTSRAILTSSPISRGKARTPAYLRVIGLAACSEMEPLGDVWEDNIQMHQHFFVCTCIHVSSPTLGFGSKHIFALNLTLLLTQIVCPRYCRTSSTPAALHGPEREPLRHA